ncbi:MAG TPA: hypothetical protein VF363_11170 [Candidatus Eisenbacteria bacterium]
MPAPRSTAPRREFGSLDWALPALVALVLSIPMLRYGFLWDDYTFLNEARSFSLGNLSPFHPSIDPFWRPITREIYFGLIERFGAGAAVVGHLLNLVVLVADVSLLVRFATPMLGRRAAFLAGLVFSGLGALSFVAGWVSGAQDLLAMFLVLLALTLRTRGATGAALAASVAALLCKETAAVFLPVVACLSWIEGKTERPRARDVAPYAVIGIAWAAIHPGIRGLIERRFGGAEQMYIGGVEPGEGGLHLLRYFLTLLNIPQPDRSAAWLPWMAPLLAAAIVLVIAGIRLANSLPAARRASGAWPRNRVVAASLYMTVVPVLFTAAFVRIWQPYYTAIGGIGLSMLAGAWLVRQRTAVTAAILVAFVVLGVRARSQAFDPDMLTERNFESAGAALAKLERGFRSLHARLPADSRVVLSTQVGDVVHTHLFKLQVLRQWYRDASIQTLPPDARRTRRRPERFFLVTPRLDVAEIDPSRFAFTPAGLPVEYSWAECAFRGYALGLYASGDVAGATAMLTGMPEVNEPIRNSHHRLAAALLLAAGRREEAERLLAPLDSLPRDYALANVAAFLAEPMPGEPIDGSVLRAFGFDVGDREAWLTLARWSAENGRPEAGLRYVGALLKVDAGNAEAAALRERLRQMQRQEVTFPLEDAPPLAPRA